MSAIANMRACRSTACGYRLPRRRRGLSGRDLGAGARGPW